MTVDCDVSTMDIVQIYMDWFNNGRFMLRVHIPYGYICVWVGFWPF